MAITKLDPADIPSNVGSADDDVVNLRVLRGGQKQKQGYYKLITFDPSRGRDDEARPVYRRGKFSIWSVIVLENGLLGTGRPGETPGTPRLACWQTQRWNG